MDKKTFNFQLNTYNKFVSAFFSNLFFVYSLIIAVALILFSSSTIECEVVGDSMKPTYNQTENINDIVYVNKYDNDYTYGDIVVIDSEDNSKPIIKRIVGIPGDTIDIVFSINCYYLEVNGELINEPYLYDNGISYPTIAQNGMNVTFDHFEKFKDENAELLIDGKLLLQNDEYFVLGDNRGVSLDSSSQGAFKKGEILGKVERNRKDGENSFDFYYNYIVKGEFFETIINML